MSFEIRRLTKEDENDVLQLIVKHFSRDFYHKWLGLDGDDVDLYNVTRAKKKLQQNWSVGAFEKKTNKLVGVELIVAQEKGKSLHPKIGDFPHNGMQLSYDLLGVARFFEELEADVFDLLGANKLLIGGMGTVHKQYRQQGIFKMMGDEIKLLSIESGCDYMIGTPTNEYLCRDNLISGFKVLREISYRSFYEKTKLKIFLDAKYPYVKAQLVYKRIEKRPKL